MNNDARNSHDFYAHRKLVLERIQRALVQEKRNAATQKRKTSVDTVREGSWYESVQRKLSS